MIVWFLSLFSSEVLSKALRGKRDVAHLSIFSAADLEAYHKAIQAEILGLGVEMFQGMKPKHVFAKAGHVDLH